MSNDDAATVRGAFSLTKMRTMSADCAPIWRPKLPPLSPTNAGQLQPVPVRQLTRPKPARPPMPSPARTTPGTTATQTACLNNAFGGERSGTDVSSDSTSPARLARSASSESCARNAGAQRTAAAAMHIDAARQSRGTPGMLFIDLPDVEG